MRGWFLIGLLISAQSLAATEKAPYVQGFLGRINMLIGLGPERRGLNLSGAEQEELRRQDRILQRLWRLGRLNSEISFFYARYLDGHPFDREKNPGDLKAAILLFPHEVAALEEMNRSLFGCSRLLDER